ncbi:MAG: two-component hybrid sensor and regulator [Gammaproteobacteria bacterium]|nr:two-component hybrid sensor and regulator [Gammaproteobacteria bacterium]
MERSRLDEPQGADEESEETSILRHFGQIVAGVKDYAVFTLDVAGHITSWNAGAENIKGYKAEEIIGKHFSRFYLPEAIARNWPEQELKIAAGQGRIEEEGWRLRKDGTRFWADVVITALRNPAGRLTGFLKITRDLTERRRHEETLRESEQRFRLLVDSVKEYAIFMLDTEGRVASWNLGAERIIGYTAAEIIGRHFSCFYPAEAAERGAAQQELDAAIAYGSLETNGRQVRKDGSRFWANVVITAVHDLDGKLRGFAKITRDLTERKQFEELEESRQRTQEFLAMLSHELRNPLAPMRTSVDILRMRALTDPVVLRARDVIERQVLHLTRLIDDLLDVSRITSGRIRLSNEAMELETVIDRAVEAARPLIDTKGHSLEIKPLKSPAWIRGDPTRLTQVFVNLLNNAAKYTPDRGHIEIEIAGSDDDAEIHIRDNGVGIAAELLPRVFDLFTQGHRPLDRADGGLGIGLALVHRIVSLHGGTVKALSAGTGRGSEFVVTLPIFSQETSMNAVPCEPTGQQPRRRRLMVIDDNKDAAESMSMLLELWGHEVVCAYDGRTALEAAAKYHPDAVFLDIGLPGMSGYEIAERLRELPESARAVLIAITGYGQDDDRRRSRDAGIDHHLVKPVAPETLHNLLDSLEVH